MRQVSELYRRLLEDPAHVMECRLRIAGVYYDESRLVSLSTTETMFSEDTLSAGAAVAREIDLSGFLEDDIPRMAQLVPELRLRLGDETSEWIQKGVFYIDTRSRDPVSGLTSIHGFDAMLMGEQKWQPDQRDEFPMSMADAVTRLCAVMGVELDPRTVIKTGSAYRVDYPLADNTTVRQVLRWIAGAHGGNWIMSDEGKLLLVPLNALTGQTGYLVDQNGKAITFGGTRIIVGDFTADGTARFGEKAFVGQSAAAVEMIPALQPVSRIILKTDDENAYQAGDESGLTLEIDCAYGSQAMANDLLAQLGGYAYQPLQVEDGLLDPAAELGDGVTVNRVYTVLAQRTLQYDLQGASDFGAPGQAELESEYPFQSVEQQKYDYKFAQNYSLIEKTAEQIRMEVADQVNGLSSQITQTASSLNIRITNEVAGLESEISQTASSLSSRITNEVDGLESRITQTASSLSSRITNEVAGLESEISQTESSLSTKISSVDGRVTSISADLDGVSAEVRGLEGEYTSLALTVDGLTITDSGGTTRIKGSSVDTSTLNVRNINFSGVISFDDLTDTEDLLDDLDTALGYADDALTTAEDAQETVESWRYGNSTYIDGSMLKTGTVMASELLGGTVGLLTSTERTAGGIDITGSSSSSYAIELWSNGALRLTASNGDVYIEDGSGAALDFSGGRISTNCALYPNDDAVFNLGRSAYRWGDIWASNDTIQTSDQNSKNSIEGLPEKYVDMFNLLRPVRYKLNSGTSGRYHVGYIAQEVKEAMDAAGIDSLEFGGWVRDYDADGNEIYMLRYGEFDAIRDAKIKQLESRLEKLEGVLA